MTKPLHLTYDGQIMLCPPDDTLAYDISSFGMIVMYLSKYNTWRGLNQPNNSVALGTNEADTICRQLGYTGARPGSAVTRRAVPDYTFHHC